MKKKKKTAEEPIACDLHLYCDLTDCRAVPEIHTGLTDEEDTDLGDPEFDHGICFDTVAIPEIDIAECLQCRKMP